VFDNITGGYINIKPTSVASGTTPASLDMVNVTVSNSDFKYKTFFVLNNYGQLTVTRCTMKRNSAYFRGTILSILGINSSAIFRQCNFNNNNGIIGGVFYVARNSYVEVQNSTLFSNYAVVASLGYISNQGRIIIDSSDISFNKAISIGILEIVDSTVTSTFTNNTVYSNTLVTKEVTIKELDDPTI
jgi:hypothetical protein